MTHDYPDEWLLPRSHDLATRCWQLPRGENVSEAVNEEAIELLKNDPEEFFRRTRIRLNFQEVNYPATWASPAMDEDEDYVEYLGRERPR